MSYTKTKKTLYEVTEDGLNARLGPGVNHPIKKVRKKGFRFFSTTRSGNWVKASTYWYHSGYLKKVGQTSPSCPITVKFGTFNLPLDPEKLPRGDDRAVWAARQIIKNNVDVLAVQELSRDPSGEDHIYAKKLLKNLGKDWGVVKPSSPYNENYFFYNKKKIKFVKREPDLILRTPDSGKHATRVIFSMNKVNFMVYNTHLVNGDKKTETRKKQSQIIVDDFTSKTIVMGDLNQSDLPAPFTSTHKTARLAAQVAPTKNVGTYLFWGSYKATKKYLDHIVVDKSATVHTYEVVGFQENNIDFIIPKISDHLLVTALVTFK